VVVMAIGQGPNPLLARLTPSLKTNRHGNILVDKTSLAVDSPGPSHLPPYGGSILCAGGDIIGGQAGAGGTVIAAMGHGKVAARTIHHALQERRAALNRN
jgi:glutamate synthase (NADPH/NADH) small chain